MPAWQRFGLALAMTIALAIGGMIYNEVFVAELLPLVDPEGTFSTPVMWLDAIVPLILVTLLLAVWGWAIAGGVQEERSTNRMRRMR